MFSPVDHRSLSAIATTSAALVLLSICLSACLPSTQDTASTAAEAQISVDITTRNAGRSTGITIQPGSDGRLVSYTEQREPCDHYTPNRVPLFGDLHVHTRFSFDAAANTIGATPTDAYQYGQGKPISFWPMVNGKPGGSFRIDRPLDFLAVTDHGEFLGERRLCRESDSPRYNSEFCKATRVSERQSMMMFGQVMMSETPSRLPDVCGEDGSLCREFARQPWQQIGDAAEAAYDRSSHCTFTSFKAYEYTGTPGTSNYHRNVIFRNENVPDFPVSYIDAPYDSALWDQLDDECLLEGGCSYLTIPHNTNLANGRMAPYMRLDPTMKNRRAYAAKRLEREPILEIFQHKGASECINGLSSVLGQPDELCNIEAVRVMGQEETYAVTNIQGSSVSLGEAKEVTEECGDEVGANGMLGAGCVHVTDYLRSALLVGLEEEQETGLNPVKLGIIASTDTHTAAPGSVVESDWRGHVSMESSPEERLQPGLLTSGIDGNPGGLAGVWAVENSRDAIFESMLRREVFGTTGPRIAPRFFAGWSFEENLCERSDKVEVGYATGVPMGGDLSAPPSSDAKPTFFGAALRDPSGAPLQKMQLIKGWIDADGKRRNEVLTIAGGPNGAGVDLTTGKRTGEGHDGFCEVYRDENFDSSLPTYYYLRVVENPSARWSFHDCMRIPEGKRPAVCTDGSYPSTIQEMAWSSPIWYQP